MRTLNQLIEVFKDFADSHGQIRGSFGVGDLWEVGMSGKLNYPVLWINPTDSRVIKGVGGYSTTETTFRVFILDRVDEAETNENEVLSDTNLIGHDLIRHIDSDPVFLNGDYTFNNGDITFEFVTEKLKDKVSGVYMSLAFQYPFNLGCSTPYNS
jgi:hypothetical protein